MSERCQTTRDLLSAYVDGELPPAEAEAIADHLATCAQCSAEYQTMLETVAAVRSQLERYAAPDVLRARIRAALATTPVESGDDVERSSTKRVASTTRPTWIRAAARAAAVVLAAALGSGVTLLASNRRADTSSVATQVLSSHVRSLMPDHLTDIRSTDQHNVKPWFNGRLDYSPNVPRFDEQGYSLIGGRVDYIGNRPVAVVVYSRRQHLINVFSWPAAGVDQTLTSTVANGYNMLHWRSRGIEKWVASDLNAAELAQFATMVRAADSATTTISPVSR